MTAVTTRFDALICRAAPSLMIVKDSTPGTEAEFFELWDTRPAEVPRVARFMLLPDGQFAGWSAGEAPDIYGTTVLEDFLQALREIEARA